MFNWLSKVVQLSNYGLHDVSVLAFVFRLIRLHLSEDKNYES